MIRGWKYLLILGAAFTLFGCLDVTPKISAVEVGAGQSQIFTAKSNLPNAEVVWTLDGVEVARGNQYAYVAERNGSDAIRQLVAAELGGTSLRLRDTYTWTIKVLPGCCICYLDEDADGFGDYSQPVTTDDPPFNCVEDSMDCDDTNPAINPAAQEIINGIDDNCDGVVDGGDHDPIDVTATDIESGLSSIHVMWNSVQSASYYNVYRCPYVEDGDYALVGDHIVSTFFDYVQTWEDDIYAAIGDPPGLAPAADDAARVVFINRLNAYRQAALPVLFNFKAPAFFKVQPCNDNGCAALSDADAGQAEYIHTAEFSEVAEQVIPLWEYAPLLSLADAPQGPNGMAWCGIDVCGSGGGIAMGRASVVNNTVNVDMVFEAFTETLAGAPGSHFMVSGSLGGANTPLQALNDEFILAGDVDIEMNAVSAHLAMFIHVAKVDPGTGALSTDTWANITYKGVTHQFTLPIQTKPGEIGAIPITPVIPPRTDRPGWEPSKGVYPELLSTTPPNPSCQRNWAQYEIPTCPATIAP